MDDVRIIEKIKARNEDGLHDLKQKYNDMLFYIVRNILKDPLDVEECVNDIYLKIWLNIDQYNPQKSKFHTYISKIARNTAIDFLRKSGKDLEHLDERENVFGQTMSPEDVLIRKEKTTIFNACLKMLSESDQELVIRKYYYCQSSEDIGILLGISRYAVDCRLYRVKRQLRKYLKEADIQ